MFWAWGIAKPNCPQFWWKLVKMLGSLNFQTTKPELWGSGWAEPALKPQTLGARQALLIIVMPKRMTNCRSRRPCSFKNNVSVAYLKKKKIKFHWTESLSFWPGLVLTWNSGSLLYLLSPPYILLWRAIVIHKHRATLLWHALPSLGHDTIFQFRAQVP